jgi:hypothetical protein
MRPSELREMRDLLELVQVHQPCMIRGRKMRVIANRAMKLGYLEEVSESRLNLIENGTASATRWASLTQPGKYWLGEQAGPDREPKVYTFEVTEALDLFGESNKLDTTKHVLKAHTPHGAATAWCNQHLIDWQQVRAYQGVHGFLLVVTACIHNRGTTRRTYRVYPKLRF